MNTYDSLPTYQLQRKYAALSHILESNTIGSSTLTQTGRDLVCNEMAVIADILDNREWVTDAGLFTIQPTYNEAWQLNGFEPVSYPAFEAVETDDYALELPL